MAASTASIGWRCGDGDMIGRLVKFAVVAPMIALAAAVLAVMALWCDARRALRRRLS